MGSQLLHNNTRFSMSSGRLSAFLKVQSCFGFDWASLSWSYTTIKLLFSVCAVPSFPNVHIHFHPLLENINAIMEYHLVILLGEMKLFCLLQIDPIHAMHIALGETLQSKPGGGRQSELDTDVFDCRVLALLYLSNPHAFSADLKG